MCAGCEKRARRLWQIADDFRAFAARHPGSEAASVVQAKADELEAIAAGMLLSCSQGDDVVWDDAAPDSPRASQAVAE